MPPNTILRHNFIEFFCRISELKFKLNNKKTSYDCIEQMTTYIKPYWQKFDQNIFRETVF